MRNLGGRIEKLEKKVGTEENVLNIMVTIVDVDEDGTERRLAEPVEQWTTYDQQITAKPANGRRIIILDPETELQERAKVAAGNIK